MADFSLVDVLALTHDEEVARLARQLQKASDEAWEAAAAWEHRSNVHQGARDAEASYHRGRAHGLCEALGDQSRLGDLLASMETGPSAVGRVRALHRCEVGDEPQTRMDRHTNRVPLCVECDVTWPCDTVKALGDL